MSKMRERTVLDASVDAPPERSVSFAPLGQLASARASVSRSPADVGMGPASGVVPLGRGGPLRDEVVGFPVQLAKVQPPALRDETLARPRLLDWLAAKLHHRVILLIADAGFGKTTLLADFSRRTRVRTLWYRLDADDRDWTSILHHLVAAGREHEPGFAPTTASLLAEIGVGGPTRDAVVETFVRELSAMVEGGALLIFDDFHLVDDAPDARYVARELVARAPERLTIAFASRRAPTIPLGRLRAVGEVAEVGTDDLRFDASETALLFTETYGRSIEPDILRDLAVRTEGWIASLQLVQAALRNRTPREIRQFVRDLSGADSDLYDYLAEEVVGDLPEDLQRFLMTTSVLQIVTPEMAEVVSDEPGPEVARLTIDAERLTLLSRVSGGPRTHLRYHPLVREFLEARLRSADGDADVDDLHRRAGAAAASTDWRVAAHHYREAHDLQTMLDVINDAVPTIMGNAQYSLAAAFVVDAPSEIMPPGSQLIKGRIDYQEGDFEAATAAAQAVLDSASAGPVERDHAMLNLLAVSFNYGYGERALVLADHLESTTSDPNLRSIARASAALLRLETAADIESLIRLLRSMAKDQRDAQVHHFGVSMYNLATISVQQDRLADAEREVGEALEAFGDTSSKLERNAATALLISVLARLGRLSEALALLDGLLSGGGALENDVLLEAAEAFDGWGNPDTALQLFERVGDLSTQSVAERRLWVVTAARMALRDGRPTEARAILRQYPEGVATMVGIASSRDLLVAQCDLFTDAGHSRGILTQAQQSATGSGLYANRRIGEILQALATSPEAASRSLVVIGHDHLWHITAVADLVADRLDDLTHEAVDVALRAARLHPDRWRAVLRKLVQEPRAERLRAAEMLEEIGEKADIALLRQFARGVKRRRYVAMLGRTLARRLADRVFVEDQGRTAIRIGDSEVAGSSIRRKVLALLCFLLTRPNSSATRDQVLDALWPEQDPDVAVNSLNQTIYFLRRVFEEDFAEDLSPGYVHHDGDVVWLDPELVTSRSIQCRVFIRQITAHSSPTDIASLADLYRGRFAMDFEYEEWSSAYRDGLHAAYLEILERAVRADFGSGHYDRAIALARRTLEVDPDAEQVEVALLRLYRATGAHAAAAEQYGHYANYVRDELGTEPIPLESL